MNDFWKYENYKRFLVHIRDRYPILLFGEQDSRNGILLRHDVDYSVEKAYSMALIEKMCGVKSAFHVMVSARTYNVFAEENRRMLEKIVAIGFDIGLHFDPSIYPKERLREAVDAEAKALQFVTGKPIDCISTHNPHAYGEVVRFDGYKTMGRAGIFLADSSRTFRGVDPYEFVKQADNAVVQLVLHPCYYGE